MPEPWGTAAAFASTTLAAMTLVAGKPVFSHTDAPGTIAAPTDGAGALVQRHAYEAFGSLLGSQGTVAQPCTYTARERDAESG